MLLFFLSLSLIISIIQKGWSSQSYAAAIKKNFLVSESAPFSVPVRHADMAGNRSTDNNYTNQTLISLSYIFLMTQCNQIKSFGNDLVVCFFLVGETLIMCKYRSRKKKLPRIQ